LKDQLIIKDCAAMPYSRPFGAPMLYWLEKGLLRFGKIKIESMAMDSIIKRRNHE
jgi:hypothetical protein